MPAGQIDLGAEAKERKGRRSKDRKRMTCGSWLGREADEASADTLTLGLGVFVVSVARKRKGYLGPVVGIG